MRTEILYAKLGEATLSCWCEVTKGTCGSFDEPAEGPVIDIIDIDCMDKNITYKLNEKAYENIYDQLYENYREDNDELWRT